MSNLSLKTRLGMSFGAILVVMKLLGIRGISNLRFSGPEAPCPRGTDHDFFGRRVQPIT